ncbi:MAG: acetyl-CoA carboxylase biotin carboxyl carrier protein [Planctomycetes bacterium]|nr:acetyl-CoA carboxylase biotin carboxyl carrier protein [Planctomycetota bacterium]
MAAKRKSPTKARSTSKAPSSSGKAAAAKPKKPAPGGAKRSRGAASPGADRLGQLERLMELMEQKGVVEVEVEDVGTRWRVRRTEPQTVTYAAPPPMAMAPMAMAPMPSVAGAAAPAAAGAPAEPEGEVFKSPMLGTFYRAASPDAEPFCKAGDRVTADRTLCIIEAMKVMNEIKAEREFEILDVLVKNGEPVEYGQPLFLIR